jgi:hypothetical protein
MPIEEKKTRRGLNYIRRQQKMSRLLGLIPLTSHLLFFLEGFRKNSKTPGKKILRIRR